MKNDFLRETKFSFTRYLWPIIFLITELKVLFNRFQKDLEFSTIASILESFSILLFQSFLKRLLFSRLMIFLFWSTISSRELKLGFDYSQKLFTHVSVMFIETLPRLFDWF